MKEKSMRLLSVVCFLSWMLLLPASAGAACQVNYAGEIPIEAPVAITADQEGRLYVSQKSGTVRIIDQEGKTAAVIGGDTLQGLMKNPAGLHVFGDRLYVADSKLDRICVFTTDGTFVEYYGRHGSDPGQFKHPSDVYVYKKAIYVTDTGNDRVQVLGENGVFIQEFGQFETEHYTLHNPRRLAVNHEGKIFVADESGRVKIYSPDGDYVGSMAESAEVGALTTDEKGIFIADNRQCAIKKYDFTGRSVMNFGSAGRGRAQFETISALTVTPAGKVYVTDVSRNLIQAFLPDKPQKAEAVYQATAPPTSAVWEKIIKTGEDRKILNMTKNGDKIYAVAEEEKALLAINKKISPRFTFKELHPEAIAFDAKDNPFILVDKQIIKLTPQGAVDYKFGSSEGSSMFSYKPGDMTITGAKLVYVADRYESAIKVYNTDGIFIRTIDKYGGGDPLADPVAVAHDSAGNLYLLDAGCKSVAIFSAEGRLVRKFSVADKNREPVDLAVAAGNIYVADAGGHHVDLFTKKGKYLAGFSAFGEAGGCLDTPSVIIADENGDFWVAEEKNKRIQKFELCFIPPAPQNIRAAGSSRQVKIRWQVPDEPGAGGIDHYTVYRSEDPAARPEKLATCRTAEFVDRTAVTGKKYYYRVTAHTERGNASSMTAPVEATAKKLSLPPPRQLSALPGDISVRLSWKGKASQHLDHYSVYKNGKKMGTTTETAFRVKELVPETVYNFQVSSVSTDGVESKKAAYLRVKTQPTTRPPVEIEIQSLSDIFSNTYKNYEKNGIGRVLIRNNTKENISKLRVQFTIKKFMDFPSETKITNLKPGQSREVPLKAVFNDNILNVTEDTPVQTEVTASYYLRGKKKSFSTQKSIHVYEKHKMRWDDPKRLGAFVTTKDRVVLEFARHVVTQYEQTTDPLISACVIFDALGAAGITYTIDPSNSYQETKQNTRIIDYLQYPRETLRRRSGDCDDLVILYTSALESIGIRTRFVEVPGHILMMFAVGHKDQLGTDTMQDMLVIGDEGTVWVPVETTWVGKSFTDAWEAGSRNYYRWSEEERSGIDVHQAWNKYKPASLPSTDAEPPKIERATIDKQYNNEYDIIRKTSIKIQYRDYIRRLEKNPGDIEARVQLGIAYAGYGILDEARNLFEKALEKDPKNASLLNNLANIHYLNQNCEAAIEAYQEAIAADPDDNLIRINLVKALLQAGEAQKAKAMFKKARRIDPELRNQYRSLALKLPGPG